ncbi:trichoplein keratin filament-binding protein-like [Bolinopsis microptera]|uniref:trichoplein keratin filament-binding protein-like n=1 Tax=Bolinopsis microptera TaxID=2820187 RepID=UPI0030799AC3
MALPHMQRFSRPPATKDQNYYVKVANDTSKQRQWNSARCMERSVDAYRESYTADTKGEKLAERRRTLAELLQHENMLYQSELRNSRLNPGIMGDMSDRVTYLREQKEIQRKKIADEKMKQHLRLNAPELRNLNSNMLKQEVQQGWTTQRAQNSQRQEEKKQEKLEEIMEEERAKIRYQLERKEQEEERRADAAQQAGALREQMEKLKLREKESAILKAQEEDLYLQQDELAAAEKMRRDMEQKREKIQFGRLLKAQALAALRRRSRQIQEELELDLKILRNLADKETEVQDVMTARREKAKADAKWMKQVVEEQLQLERAREAELETLYREEAARQWEKRENQWQREGAARERLMKEVLEGRVDQLARKQDEVRSRQDEALRAREELIDNMELLAQETGRQTERTARQRDERRREIDHQNTERRRAEEDERLAEEALRAEEGRAAEEYAQMIRQEANTMTKRGYIPRGKRNAWM